MKSVGKKTILRARKPSLFLRVVGIVEEARQKVATVANIAQVYTNYEIGRQIVEDEQEKISELKASANKNARPPRAFFCPAADLRSLTFSQLCAKMAAFSLKMRNCHEQKTA